MSDRPRDSNPSENTSTAGSNAAGLTESPAPSFIAPRANAGIRSVTSPVAGHGSSNPLDLPPLPQSTTAPTASTLPPTAPRLASFSSILNPLQVDEAIDTRRRKASQLESPRSSAASLPPIVTRPSEPHASSTTTAPSPRRGYGESVERPARRILTPRSPSLHRAASLGQLGQSTGAMNTLMMPFPASPRSRAYVAEPGTSGVPPLPGSYGNTRTDRGSAPTEQSMTSIHRGSTTHSQARNVSSSASPSTSYSSYSQTSQASPTAQYASGAGAAYAGAYGYGDPSSIGIDHGAMMAGAGGPERQRPLGIPISSSGGQNVYQMMTLETTSGTVQLPVDVQAASRVADEKRRRNAGASARFRQRRKEKEKEASTTISRLDQQIKELGEDADFYRRERDYLAGILMRVPGGDRHFPRPASPRHRRSSTLSLPGPSGSGSASFPSVHEHSRRSPDEGRNVRRRTSTMSLPPPPLPHQQPPGTPVQPVYGQSPFGPSLGQQPPPMSHSNTSNAPTPSMPPGPLPYTSQGPSRHTPQLPALPQVLQPNPQWGSYQSGQRPPDLNQPRENR